MFLEPEGREGNKSRDIRGGPTVDSTKLEHRCRMVYAGFLSFFGLGLEGGHVETFWVLLYLTGHHGLF